jgi:hypothetical protein
MFGISERPASQHARIACNLLAEPPSPEQSAQHNLVPHQATFARSTMRRRRSS